MDYIFKVNEGELSQASSFDIAKAAVKILDSKIASDIKMLKIDQKTIIADYFVICTGNSSTQVKTLADEVEYQLETQFSLSPSRVEGYESKNWILMDYDTVIVHVFHPEARNYYNLDKLWADGEEIELNLD